MSEQRSEHLPIEASTESSAATRRLALEDFLLKHGSLIKSETQTFCKRGVDLMMASTDPAHNIGHLERMFAGLDDYIEQNPDVHLNFDVVLTAISWHDNWRATNFKPNLIHALSSHFTEGKNAARLTREEMAKFDFDPEFVHDVSNCVYKHPDPQFSRRITAEEKILHDLDHLDSWSYERVQEIKKYLSENPKGKYLLPILRLVKKIILSKANHNYYFETFQKERDVRYPKFVAQVEELFG